MGEFDRQALLAAGHAGIRGGGAAAAAAQRPHQPDQHGRHPGWPAPDHHLFPAGGRSRAAVRFRGRWCSFRAPGEPGSCSGTKSAATESLLPAASEGGARLRRAPGGPRSDTGGDSGNEVGMRFIELHATAEGDRLERTARIRQALGAAGAWITAKSPVRCKSPSFTQSRTCARRSRPSLAEDQRGLTAPAASAQANSTCALYTRLRGR